VEFCCVTLRNAKNKDKEIKKKKKRKKKKKKKVKEACLIGTCIP